MQLMSWPLGRLGSRFGFLFEPYRNRVMHSALGRMLDRPLDLKVGFVEPDGTERVLPFTAEGDCFINCEQFERFNSITFRGYSQALGVRFEMNVHSPFYPQDEKLCHAPAFYFELRAIAVENVRWAGESNTPAQVDVFFRLRRPGTEITTSDDGPQGARIDLAYDNSLTFHAYTGTPKADDHDPAHTLPVRERVVSLTPGAHVLASGDGLTLRLPVTHGDSGIKWRLAWVAHVKDPVLSIADHRNGMPENFPAKFRYTDWLPDLDAATLDAVNERDGRLAKSRRLEKLMEQAPLDPSMRHLTNQSFQGWLTNTFLCSYDDPAAKPDQPERKTWFSVLEGSRQYHSTLNAECNSAMLYLSMWPQLLRGQFAQWARFPKEHAASGGACLGPDVGKGLECHGPAAGAAPGEHNADFLTLLQTYTHWTGDLGFVRANAELLLRLGNYLLWTDREGSGFPSEGLPMRQGGGPIFRMTPRQTYLAIKRAVALRAAADMLALTDRLDLAPDAKRFTQAWETAARQIDAAAWHHDHYAPTVDPTLHTMGNADNYAIYNINGELLPYMIGQETLMPRDKLAVDIYSAKRETDRRYGGSNSSAEPDTIRISQNLWRDVFARYLKLVGPPSAQHYWDMQVMGNTHQQSRGFTDAYIAENLAHYPRGITTLGYLLATPVLVIDRLSAGRGGTHIRVDPNRSEPARWPLLPLGDWKAGKIPVCVVDAWGHVRIESATDPVTIRGEDDPAQRGKTIG